jgi:iron complex outermembrane receptor protein
MTAGSRASLLAATAIGIIWASPSWAQAPAPAQQPATPKTETAQQTDEVSAGNDIVVTARRVNERLQDVPISITVLTPEKLQNNNIQSAKDIATYTPGLSTNNRFGSDNTTWTIRGFTQEQRTTATVGTYFADVVAPRGSGATQGGDGAGPGNLFDLQNVQVLKGPQGTLQGRNSTGGAVLLVPKRPTDRFEGYAEFSAGDYNMMRGQAVINVPVSDSLKVRLGIDRNVRDGYLKNVGKIGFGRNGDAGGSVDYWAARASVLWDVTPGIENYTVATFSHSKSTGVIPKIVQAFYREPYSHITGIAQSTPPIPLDAGQTVSGLVTANGLIALDQMAYEAAHCGGNFWCVSNPTWDSRSESKTWQAINTTTWRASDKLTVKGIMSYGEFRGYTTLDLFGLYNPSGTAPTNAISTALFEAVTTPLGVRSFSMTRSPYGGLPTNAEASYVGELQFQWHGDRFNWQGGLYFENSDPLGPSGTTFGPSQTPCGPIGAGAPAVGGAVIQTDPAQVCILGQTGNSLGRTGFSTTKNKFRDRAVYWQGMYKLTDQLKLTAGIRYTWDKMISNFQVLNLRYYVTTSNVPGAPNVQTTGFNGKNLLVPNIFTTSPGLNQGVGFCNNNVQFGYPPYRDPILGNQPGDPTNQFFPAADALNHCHERHSVKTSAPTWLLGLDYKPTDDILLYAKYSRGYRQGGVASFGLDQLQDYKDEKVDTFEVGGKASWRGAMPGYFNISAFRNNFSDQQLQIGVQCNPTANCPQTTVILNTGKSRLQGFEIEAGIEPFEGLRLQVSYAYLKTKLLEVVDVTNFILSQNSTLLGLDLRPVPVGSPIPNAVPHKLVVSGTYELPLPKSVGKLSVGATMVYTSKYRAVSDPPVLGPCAGTVNTNINLFNCGAASPPQFASSYGILPSSKVLNLNVNWEGVGGTPIDASLFVTNVTKEKTFLHVNVQVSSGFLSRIVGEPRMWGARLRYRFGE